MTTNEPAEQSPTLSPLPQWVAATNEYSDDFFAARVRGVAEKTINAQTRAARALMAAIHGDDLTEGCSGVLPGERALRHAMISGLQAPPTSEPVPDGPVRGLRQAARVLSTPKSTIGQAVRALAPHLRPNKDAAGVYWWPSHTACLTWWATVTAPPKPQTAKRRKRAQPVAEPVVKPWQFGDL